LTTTILARVPKAFVTAMGSEQPTAEITYHFARTAYTWSAGVEVVAGDVSSSDSWSTPG
jgi:hypothetical protein